jgi:hypothetical protein
MPKPEYWRQHRNEITRNMYLVFTGEHVHTEGVDLKDWIRVPSLLDLPKLKQENSLFNIYNHYIFAC